MFVPLVRCLPLFLITVLFVPFGWAESKSDYFGEFSPPAPSAQNSLRHDSADWYKDQVFYHIWVSAFADSDGNGVGDLPGITSRLDYLADLGVTSLWLSPFWKSPSTHGYDVVDYSVVDPRYGTNQDLEVLLREAHWRGLAVIFDFVPNHVSTQNPWFIDSKDSKNARRNWFLWRDQAPTAGWLDFGNRPAWHWTWNSNYYALFWEGMPDLNYREPAVRQAMADVITTWLNFGFDGMRVDAVKYLFENETTGANADQPETLDFFRRLRREVLEPYSALGYPKFMVGENWTGDLESLQAYLTSDGKTNDGLNATLDFPFGYAVTNVLNGTGSVESDLGREWENLIQPLQSAGAWTFTFLSNHDNYQSRPTTLYGWPAKVRAAQTLQMTGWGTPVLYYGNEVGMKGANGNDGNMRRPFPWPTVKDLRADPESVWSWQALLNRLRKDHPALRRGDLRVLTASHDQAASYARTRGDEQIVVVLNLTEEPLGDVQVNLEGLAFEAGVSTLVGDASRTSLEGASLTVRGLGAYGVRIYLVGTSAQTPLRGDLQNLE